MSVPLEQLVQAEALGNDQFVSHTLTGLNQAYGGHVIAQALYSAVRTVQDPQFFIQSAHCYFISPVKLNDENVVYHVTRLKDGRTISTRGVTATQGKKTVFSCLVSFSVEEKEDLGLIHTDCPMPEVDSPVSNKQTDSQLLSIKPVTWNSKQLEKFAYQWMKSNYRIRAQDKNMQRIALAYASDSYIAYGVLIDKYMYASPAVVLSLDHSIWFHESVDFSNWHLFVQKCIRSSQEKPLNIARVYSQSGSLVATVTQQSLVKMNHKL